MADTAARLAISARRNEVARFTIAVTGIDMTGVPMAMQIRLGRDVPGAPLIALATVSTIAAEGLKLDSVTVTNGVPTSIIKGRINASTMTDATKVPYAGEMGDNTTLAYAMQWTLNGDAQTRLFGDFVIISSAFGSDNAPSNRPVSYGGSLSYSGGSNSGSLSFGDQVINVSISGADILGPLVAAAITAQSEAVAAAERAEAIAASIAVPDFLNINLLDRDDLGASAQNPGRVAFIQSRLLTGTAILAATSAGWSQIAPAYVVNSNIVYLYVGIGDSTKTGVPYPRPGVFSAGAPADYTPTPNVKMHTAGGLVTYRPGVEADYFVANGATGPSYSDEIEVAKAFAEERPGQQLVIFKSSRSGSKLATPGEWLPTGPSDNYANKTIAELVALVAALQASGKTVIPILFDGKLGTNDAKDSLAEANAVQANLAALIAKFRAQVPILVGVPTMIWRIARNVSVNPYAMEVAAGQEALVAADPTVKLGNGDAIPLDNGDNLHPGYFGVRKEGHVSLQMIAGTYAFSEVEAASERIRNGTFDRNLKYYQADKCLWNAGRLQHRKEDEFFEQWFAGLTPGSTYHVGYDYTPAAAADQFQIIIYKGGGQGNPVVISNYLSDSPTGFNFVATHTSNDVRFQRNTRNSDALFDNISVRKVP